MTVTPETMLTVGIGEVGVIRAPGSLRTALGSCIGIFGHDMKAGVAGIAHIMLPRKAGGGSGGVPDTGPGKYADTAIPELIRLMKKSGAEERRIRFRIAGGAQMFAKFRIAATMDIGIMNETAVREILQARGYRILSSDTGGSVGRRITFHAKTGECQVEMSGREVKLL